MLLAPLLLLLLMVQAPLLRRLLLLLVVLVLVLLPLQTLAQQRKRQYWMPFQTFQQFTHKDLIAMIFFFKKKRQNKLLDACMMHDGCMRTVGDNRGTADKQRMRGVCWQQHKVRVLRHLEPPCVHVRHASQVYTYFLV